jgi:hypothetical protein
MESVAETEVAAPAPAPDARVRIQDLDAEVSKKLAFTKSFTVEYVNPDDGKRLVGTFTMKRPTLGDLSHFGLIKARLTGGEQVGRECSWLNEMLAFCQITLTDHPEWWDPMNSYDDELLTMLYKHVRSFQDSFRKELGG